MTLARYRTEGVALAGAILVADQLVKFIVAGPLALKSRMQIEITSFFNLTWAENRGVSMGFLTAETDTARWLLVALTGIIATIVLLWMWKERARGDILALGMILGGALGNIIDRARLGYVVDYADLHIGAFRPFMIFNVADAAITIGVLLLLARVLIIGDKSSKSDPATAAVQAGGTNDGAPAAKTENEHV
ncbi:signal peptidase II [Blastomonas sp.]|uniref:signal peptidase II n=1 Tax=Blastomonas sp. TaxID=1909299 RepID=UPI00261AE01D|nr:signal peptidase II [Blastomonas sp.]MDM7954773.1 signal peptidase II [Blastomonas sp.]